MRSITTIYPERERFSLSPGDEIFSHFHFRSVPVVVERTGHISELTKRFPLLTFTHLLPNEIPGIRTDRRITPIRQYPGAGLEALPAPDAVPNAARSL